MPQIVIGIDGGGTHTRVVVADLSGQILARVRADAASPNKTIHAQENVRNAIRTAISKSGHRVEDVVELVAGIAGLDAPEDVEWAEKFTELPGLHCPRLLVNDAVVAHAGALQSRPGIIVIAGTGSIIFGMTEAGRQLRNYDFLHYAHASARHLSYEVVYRALAGETQWEDHEFVEEILNFWNAKDVAELRKRGSEGFITDRFERNRTFAEMAPLVTDAAKRGTPLAQIVCDTATDALCVGIKLIGSCFTGETVSVALIGGVVGSDYIRQGIEKSLAKSTEPRYQRVESAFSSEVGAVLMALMRHGIAIDDVVLAALRSDEKYPPQEREEE